MSFTIQYLLCVIMGLAAGIGALQVLNPPSRDVTDRIAEVRAERARKAEERRARAGRDRENLVNRITSAVVSYIPMTRDSRFRTRERLIAAGLVDMSAETWWAINVVAAVAGAVVGILIAGDVFTLRSMGVVALCVALGPVCCATTLVLLIRQRRERIAAELPLALDLLASVCFAGLSLDKGIQQVADNLDGPVADEFRTVTGDIAAGVPRNVALKSMGKRVELDSVRSFVTAVIEAQHGGLGISNVLMQNADFIRTQRSLEIEEQAARIPVRMLPVMALFIFPTVFVVILAPFLPQVISSLGNI